MNQFRYLCAYVTALFISMLPVAVHGGVDKSQLPTTSEIYRKFLAANGGRTNILELQTVLVRGRIIIPEEGEREFKMYRKRPGRMRLKLSYGRFSVETIFDGTRAWKVVEPDYEEPTVTEIFGEPLMNLKADSSIDSPFFELYAQLDKLTPVSIEEVNGREAIRLDIDPSVETKYRSIWIDLEHYQEVQLATRATESSRKELLMRMSAFEQVDGVYVAMRSEHYVEGALVKTIEVDHVRNNLGLFDSFFSAP